MKTLVNHSVPARFRLDREQPRQDLPGSASNARHGDCGQRGRLRVHLHNHAPRLPRQEGQGSGRVYQPARTHDQADFRGPRSPPFRLPVAGSRDRVPLQTRRRPAVAVPRTSCTVARKPRSWLQQDGDPRSDCRIRCSAFEKETRGAEWARLERPNPPGNSPRTQLLPGLIREDRPRFGSRVERLPS